MENENEITVEQTSKRTRRSGDELRAAKIAALEEKIKSKEEQLEKMKADLEELKRPRELSEREKQALLKKKIDEGMLTEDEAYQIGYKG